jgi:hypothetical protein
VEVEGMKREGLENPPKQLRESLVAHPELIPYRGTGGATMAFVPGERILLLRRPYAFAEFEDGHAGGNMLLEYSILPGPRVEWKRLWAALE